MKEREYTFKRRFHRFSRRGILNSLTRGIDGWRKKITLVTVLESSVDFALSP